MKPDSTILEVPCAAARMAGFGNRKTYDRTLMRTIPRGSHRGVARLDWAGVARRGKAWHGRAQPGRLGVVWQGEAGHGEAGHGKAGGARSGKAWQGGAWPGWAGRVDGVRSVVLRTSKLGD